MMDFFSSNAIITMVLTALITAGSLKIPLIVSDLKESKLIVKYGGVIKRTYEIIDPIIAASLKGETAQMTYQDIKSKVMEAASSGISSDDVDLIAKFVIKKFQLGKII